MRRLLPLFLAAVLLFAARDGWACAADNLRWVAGADECLVIHTEGERGEALTTLAVFLHGDGSKGGPSDYMIPRARRYAGKGVIAVTLIRPGYHDSHGNTSTGISYRDKGDGYPPKVVDAVADAVADLKAFHRADKVVLVGISGGAAIAGVILGRFPGLADAAVLAGCPCDVQGWRNLLGRGNWRRSLSPHAFADKVPKDAYVVLVTGAEDTNTFPVLAQNYAAQLRALGVTADFILAPGQPHGMSGRSNEFFRAVAMALRNVDPSLRFDPSWRLVGSAKP